MSHGQHRDVRTTSGFIQKSRNVAFRPAGHPRIFTSTENKKNLSEGSALRSTRQAMQTDSFSLHRGTEINFTKLEKNLDKQTEAKMILLLILASCRSCRCAAQKLERTGTMRVAADRCPHDLRWLRLQHANFVFCKRAQPARRATIEFNLN